MVRVMSLGWLGVRTVHADAMSAFCRDVLELEPFSVTPTSTRFRMVDGTEFHIYAEQDLDHGFFGPGPVVGLVVESFAAAQAQMIARGVDLVYPKPQRDGRLAWQHFRAPDGNVYEIIGTDRREVEAEKRT